MSSPSPAAAVATAAPAAPSPPHAGRICFNSQCKERIAEPPPPPRRRGWRLRSGELADLCDRCSAAYEQGRFCETFHSDGDGWRKCESCGKRVHCGCIVSVATFMLLDVGGIECIACGRKNCIKAPNHVWQSSSLFPLGPERLKDVSGKSWSQLTASSPVPGQWRQASNLWNTSIQSELQQRLSYEFDRPNGSDRLIPGPRLPDRLASHLNRAQLDRLSTGNGPLVSPPAFNELHREGCVVGLQDSSHLVGEADPTATSEVNVPDTSMRTSAGINFRPLPNSSGNMSITSIVKDDLPVPVIGLAAPSPPPNDSNDLARDSSAESQQQTHSSPLSKDSKQNFPNAHNAAGASGEAQSQGRNGRPRPEARGRNQLLPRYWPRITDQELQQISGDSNSVITPLFEKMLSASDAGRIGRLVLPKKCAEAYFPAISQPEGLPLKVQDVKGKEWVFQFRFWPNNNSRMYVLEGVTPCIQSMKLQAGDIVTFSRMDPEGKLVMGFRKASNVSSEQDIKGAKSGNGYPTTKEVSNRNGRPGESIMTLHPRALKGNLESTNVCVPSDQVMLPIVDRSGFIQKEKTGSKTSMLSTKRKGSTLGSKNKRLRIENEDSIELKLTWEEAQELLRPPPNHKPSIVVIEGHEFEEYEEAPVLGKPAIFTVNEAGKKNQWAQCEDCSKWRKLPVNALLPPRWTCSANSWDSQRSSCFSAQEITTQELADILPYNVSLKKSKGKVENDIFEASDGLDTLANLAIMGEGESLPPSSQPTTKHPRHRPGCTCIVCIQPPSGKGPKHKQTCQCNVCLTVKRRFQTLMLRKEKRQSEKDAEKAENAHKKQQEVQMSEALSEQAGDPPVTSNVVGCGSEQMAIPIDVFEGEDCDRKISMPSPIKTHIDLNIQPDREEEPSPVSDAGNLMRLLQDAAA
uniref:B3 domain-containing protein Os07g0563300 n=1 Tax=Anthurium amnicola TaxID=1678845 RepID=A0A1D1YYL3_9ARAE